MCDVEAFCEILTVVWAIVPQLVCVVLPSKTLPTLALLSYHKLQLPGYGADIIFSFVASVPGGTTWGPQEVHDGKVGHSSLLLKAQRRCRRVILIIADAHVSHQTRSGRLSCT